MKLRTYGAPVRADARQAARIRETTIAKVLKRNRIRRFDAANVLDVFRKPPHRACGGSVG